MVIGGCTSWICCNKNLIAQYHNLLMFLLLVMYLASLLVNEQRFSENSLIFNSYAYKVMAVSESSRLCASLKKENVPVKRLIVNQVLPPSASDCKFCAMKRKVCTLLKEV